MVHHFIGKKFKEMGLIKFPVLADNAIECLNRYDWPGNVREIENAVERAIILSKGKPIRFDDILKAGIHDKDTVNITDNDIINLNEAISDHIVKVLKKTRGKIGGHGGATQLMGLHPATLRHRMRRLNIPFGRGVKYQN